MKLVITQSNAPAKVTVSFGGGLLPPSNSSIAAQAAQALATANAAIGGARSMPTGATINNDGSFANALVLAAGLNVFTGGSGAVRLPDNETGVLHIVVNFTGVPMPVWPQTGAAFLRGTAGAAYALSDTGVIQVCALSPTEAIWF